MPLQAVVPGRLWQVPYVLRFAGLPICTRMTVIRLGADRLFVHSPVPLDEAGRAAVDALGSVAFVVAPNRFHHLFVRAWRDRHPAALFCAAPGLPEKRQKVRFDRVLGDRAEPEWQGELEQHWFAGMPALNEIVFFDGASRTLLLTDVCQQITARDPRPVSWLARALGVRDRLAMSRTLKLLMLRDRAAARSSRERILKWDFERVIVAHDTIIEHDGRAAFEQALAFLG
jgi:hypothetical protein